MSIRVKGQTVLTLTNQTTNFAPSVSAQGVFTNAMDLVGLDALSVQANITLNSGSGAVLKLQASNDGVNWVDIAGSSVTITASGSSMWNIAWPSYRYLGFNFTANGASITGTLIINGIAQMRYN